jgi:hypothetical protein
MLVFFMTMKTLRFKKRNALNAYTAQLADICTQ